jgi:BASS family bile acid:Na+ symporter
MDSPLTLIGLPLVLGIIMLGLGLGLTAADFRRVMVYPRAALLALACQTLILPALCFGLVNAFALPPELAFGMMLLAASPGGAMANLYSHLFGGHVALNVTLTAVNSVLAVVTLPLIVNLSAAYYFGDGVGKLGLQFDEAIQVCALVLVPVAIGMVIRARRPRAASRLHRPVKVFSVIALAAIIAAAVIAERAIIVTSFAAVGAAVLTFNLASLLVGYGVPRVAGIGRPEAIASAMEVGIHNAALAITIAISPALMNDARVAIPAAVYGLVMFFTAAAFGYLVARKARAAQRSSAK